MPDGAAGPEAGPDDAAVIARVLAGERQEFARLVTRYQGLLYRHAVGIVLDHDVAADMVQDAFIRAYTQLRACRDRARFRSWIVQTVRNRCLDHLKEARRRNVPLEHADAISDPDGDPAAPGGRGRPRAEVEEAVAGPPPGEREAFLMHYVEGLPYDLMAHMAGAAGSGLKMRVLRA